MIRLSEAQQQILRDHLGLETMPKTKNEMNRTLLLLTRLFASKGLKNDSEPNELGLKIDELIGIFSKEVYRN